MKTLIEGHTYEIAHREDPEKSQVIDFVRKVPIEPGSTELQLVNDGTTNDEVLRVLIDRYQFLQGKFPCRENAIIITKLEECLMWTQKRDIDRVTRGVKGTNNQ